MLIVAANRRELAGISGRLTGSRSIDLDLQWSRAGVLGKQPAVLAANGAGRRNAAQAVENVCVRMAVCGVVSTGLCGGLEPALAAGQVVVAERVVTLDPAVCFPARRPRRMPAGAVCGAVLTVDWVVQRAEEKAQLRSTGAIAVEMEAAGVAAKAQEKNLPFFCIRAVSDGARQSFRIDYNRARRADGRFSAVRAAAQAGLRAGRWAELFGWLQAMERGSQALGDFLGGLEFET